MKTLNLYKVWKVLNFLNEQEEIYNNKDIYPCFLGTRSSYYIVDFENFLEYYSFKIDVNDIVIFNDDGVPYEDFTNQDFSHISQELLEFDEKELEDWCGRQVKAHIKEVQHMQQNEKENIKNQIEILTKRLEKL